MKREIRNKLIEQARLKTTISLKQLNQDLFYGFHISSNAHNQIVEEILAEISLHEHSKKRPLLSAMIKEKRGFEIKKSRSFAKLCKNIFGINMEQLKKNPSFEKEKLNECINFWKEDTNYHQHKDDY